MGSRRQSPGVNSLVRFYADVLTAGLDLPLCLAQVLVCGESGGPCHSADPEKTVVHNDMTKKLLFPS